MNIREERAKYRKWLGPFIQSVRVDAGLEQREVANRFGLSPAWLSEIENGKSNVYAYDLILFSELTRTNLLSFFRGWAKTDQAGPPRSLEDWKVLYPGQPHIAQVHYELDKSFETAELKRSLVESSS